MTLRTKQMLSRETAVSSVFSLYLSDTRDQIESQLSDLVHSLSYMSLQPQMEYAILSKGKRLRPLLVILSAESVGGVRNKVMRLALSFELMHSATLVHDDIIDHDDTRRGKLAVHRKWSVGDAVLTGDALIALAVDLASEYGQPVLKTVAQSALDLCDGAYKDVTFSLRMVTEQLYFEKIKEKSASLFRASTFCGALAGGGTPAEVDSLSMFGENLGIAYQLRDDIIDLSQKGKLAVRDLKSGVINLPLIHAYGMSSLSEKRKIETRLEAIMNSSLDESYKDVESLVRLVIRKKSLRYCEQKVDQYLCKAIDCLAALKDTRHKDYLVEMAEALGTPD